MRKTTVTVTFDLTALSQGTEQGAAMRRALWLLATHATGPAIGDDGELLDVLADLPPHCSGCGVLAPEWIAGDIHRYGGPDPEEVCHEQHPDGTCDVRSWDHP